MTLNVILVTYNHSKFIQDSLRGILFQKTNFDFDIIVADDYSTDDTLAQIREVEAKSTISFRYLSSERNLGISQNYRRAFEACDAKYVAVLEGDDFWTTPDRLQKHVDFLEHHYECAMSYNRFIRGNIEAARYVVFPEMDSSKEYHLFTARDVASNNIIGNFSCCVYRKSALDTLPKEMFDFTTYDWFTNIMVGKAGMIGCLTDVMSFYRIHSEGMWSSNDEIANMNKLLEYIQLYDEFTDHMFQDEFASLRAAIEDAIASITHPVHPKANLARPILRRIKDLTPPILVYLLKLIIPSKIWIKIGGDPR